MVKLGRICWNSDITKETEYGNIIVYYSNYKSYVSQKELSDHFPTGYKEWWEIIENPSLDDLQTALKNQDFLIESAKIVVANRQDDRYKNIEPTPEFMKTSLQTYKLCQSIHEYQKKCIEQEIQLQST